MTGSAGRGFWPGPEGRAGASGLGRGQVHVSAGAVVVRASRLPGRSRRDARTTTAPKNGPDPDLAGDAHCEGRRSAGSFGSRGLARKVLLSPVAGLTPKPVATSEEMPLQSALQHDAWRQRFRSDVGSQGVPLTGERTTASGTFSPGSSTTRRAGSSPKGVYVRPRSLEVGIG